MARALAAAGDVGWTEVDAFGRGRVAVAGDAAVWGDIVLARKEVPTSYHLSVVVDDAEQGISHVVRGADLRAATAVHRVLQTILGLPAPVYRHHVLVLGPDGRKLSKSAGSEGLGALRGAGVTAAEVRRRLAAEILR
jgi:glutamyl-Q tRNA(Asp) synthetase